MLSENHNHFIALEIYYNSSIDYHFSPGRWVVVVQELPAAVGKAG